MSDTKHQHLNMIQSTIGRLASNSFQIKGWSVVIVSALFALSAADSNKTFALIALFPAAIFGLLDGYFLMQERLFRHLYDEVRGKDVEAIDYSMNTEPFSGKESWIGCCFSQTILLFHGAVLASCIIVYFA